MKIKFVMAIAMCLGTFAAITAQTATTTKPNEVNARLENQHDRIQQGVKSGELTKREAKTLRTQERTIHKQVATERATNGGKLTKGEHAQVNKELNAESKTIYRKKHNTVVKHN